MKTPVSKVNTLILNKISWHTPLTAIGAALLLFQGLASAMPSDLSVEDPEHDFLFMDIEPYVHFQHDSAINSSQSDFWRSANQLAFPSGHIGSHDLYGVVKTTFIQRNLVYAHKTLNAGTLQRYWISGGATLLQTPTQNSTLMIGIGHNSDAFQWERKNWQKDWNTEWLYMHSFTRIKNFSWGMGIDVQQYFRKFAVYPLIFMDWKISDQTKFQWDADYAEIRHFLGPKLALTLGFRVNLEFFALQNDGEYEYRSFGGETGAQYSLGKHFYLRLKYKELMWGREILGLPDGTHHTTQIESGRSLRLNLAYGL